MEKHEPDWAIGKDGLTRCKTCGKALIYEPHPEHQ